MSNDEATNDVRIEAQTSEEEGELDNVEAIEGGVNHPGRIIPCNKSTESNSIVINKEKGENVLVCVKNLGNQTVKVGSHFNFIEANKNLEFDRSLAFGMRLVSSRAPLDQWSFEPFLIATGHHNRTFRRENWSSLSPQRPRWSLLSGWTV